MEQHDNQEQQQNGTSADGAFKLYSVADDNKKVTSDQKLFKKGNESFKPNEEMRSQQSPFISIETTNQKQTESNKSETSIKKPSTRGPIRRYRSGSTSALNVKGRSNAGGKQMGEDGHDSKKQALMQRPATQNDLLYTVDSDDSTVVDNLIKDPQKLKEQLKQSRMEREQLSQLQQNYLRLLEQYAEAENFIDMFRLGGQAVIDTGGTGTNAHVTPNAKMFQVVSSFCFPLSLLYFNRFLHPENLLSFLNNF